MVKFSIIIPIYNTERYLEECLKSVITQTYDNIEVICINDGSTDDSSKILQFYTLKDNRLKIFHQSNQGLSNTRNNGIAKAKGEYIWFIDSDDTINNDACVILNNYIEKTDPDIIVFGMNDINNEKNKGSSWFKSISSTRFAWYSPFSHNALFYEKGGYPFSIRNIYKMNMINKYNIACNNSLSLGEDVAFQFSAFPYADKILFIPDKIYNYRRMREGSITQSSNDLYKKCDAHIKTIIAIHHEWTNRKLIEKYGFHFYCWALDYTIMDMQNLCHTQQVELAHNLYPYMAIAINYYEQMQNWNRNLLKLLMRWVNDPKVNTLL